MNKKINLCILILTLFLGITNFKHISYRNANTTYNTSTEIQTLCILEKQD